jgi:hypothetical protein
MAPYRRLKSLAAYISQGRTKTSVRKHNVEYCWQGGLSFFKGLLATKREQTKNIRLRISQIGEKDWKHHKF